MDLEIIILSKASQIEKDKYHMILITCGIIYIYIYTHTHIYIYTHMHIRTYMQNRNRPTDIDNKPMVTKGERRQTAYNIREHRILPNLQGI